MSGIPAPDYPVFASPDFDANDYANAVLAGEPYPPPPSAAASAKPSALEPAREDISVAIAKLNYGIDDVDKQIKNVVTTHHEGLLVQAAGVGDLEHSLGSVRSGLDDLDTSLAKLRSKIRDPYQALQANVTRLQRLQQVSDALRRTSRFVMLAKRLQAQMADLGDGLETAPERGTASETKTGRPSLDGGRRSATPALDLEGEKERTLAQAALSVTELSDLLEGSQSGATSDASNDPPAQDLPPHSRRISLREVRPVAAHIPFIDSSRARVTADMESMVLTGLTEINQSLLASSLQTAHNLRVLPQLVQNLVSDLTDAVESRIRSAFDVSRISKELISKESAPSSLAYKSRVRMEPTNLTAPQWTNALWARLTSLIEDLTSACIKVYTLEKVLKRKKDPVSQAMFLDEAMKLLEDKPSSTFWGSLGQTLEKQCRDGAKTSTFLQQTLSTGYPRLLRLFHDFFSSIAVHTDTVYTSTYQSPETILVLHALGTFESLYLSRASARLTESVGHAFHGGARTPPTAADGVAFARALANELDAAKFDPLLVRALAQQHVRGALEMALARADAMVVRDRSATALAGPAATAAQIGNAAAATFLYHVWVRVEKLEEEYPEAVYEVLRPAVKDLGDAFGRIVEPLLGVVRRELSAIIAKLHKIDFAADVDPMSGGMGGASAYVKELAEKLTFVKAEILARFNVGPAGRDWVIAIVTHVIKTFVLHVSIAKPLNESGKLQLTSDMTELEFALSAFMLESPQSKRGGSLDVIGEDYRALRAMRPLLFLDNASLASRAHTAGLPPLIVLHHILVRSPIALPHRLHGWQEAEYVRWVEEHSAEEALTLVDGGLAHWERMAESEGAAEAAEAGAGAEYVLLARRVLDEAGGRR
ncbi:hypothetical protein HETIRDRAFT_476235 [Heterobasidion irregulare TC 32-1]|uniref:Conserved oligomeric Golgi complex subunit 5 n=1 Tax=Heterobasidion irregulare (strain TC 32-1) TaxID=747525 RepID=W4K404_HETIT|nr:uncharacterized protein HETIRDRAFT_476235 [Heterobasidion irregulare TC 32-1]ETW80568.1 hypothetical protein HETIRDRAFT_476235 [Heterobasidion irregulare TC 32-1]